MVLPTFAETKVDRLPGRNPATTKSVGNIFMQESIIKG